MRFAAVALLLAALAPVPGVAAPPDDPWDPAGPAWNQFGGNAGRTWAATVEPVRGAPRVAWKRPMPPEDVENVVVADGTIYVASADRAKNRTLLQAISLLDGRSIATKDLGRPAGMRIAVSRGMVVVAGAEELRGFQLQGASFTKRWGVKGEFPEVPAVHADVVHAGSGGVLRGHDAVTGKSESRPPSPSPAGSPCAMREEGSDPGTFENAYLGARSGYEGTWAWVSQVSPRGLNYFACFLGSSPESADLRLARLPATGAARGAWLLYSPVPFSAEGEDVHTAILSDGGERGLVPLAFPPMVYRGQGIGFGAQGTLVAVDARGVYFELVERKDLPRGARPGPATRARGVAYFGNWALDLDSRRVLWTLPDLDAAGPALPVADRTLLVATRKGDLLCLTDRPETGAAPAAAGAAAPAAGAAPPAEPPLAGDGLLLADGTSIPGAVEPQPGGGFRVAVAGGPPRDAAPGEVLLARSGGTVVHRGRESAVLGLWRRALHPSAVKTLAEVHARLAKEGLRDAAAATLADAQSFGMDEAASAEAARRSAAVKPNGFAERVLAGLEPEIRRARTAARAPLLEAAEWCRERGFPAAAACLLLDAARLSDADGAARARVAATVPEEFPLRAAKDATAAWLDWAPALAAADARFLGPSDPLRVPRGDGAWAADSRSLALRTPNLLLRTRIADPQVVGRCLANGEFVCRALESLLGSAAVRPVARDRDLMEVRLHDDQAAYRAELAEGGGDAPPWSAGCYSPSEGISRFFLPAGGSPDPLGRSLFQVLAHELTHHFLDRRWKRVRPGEPRNPAAPGYWAIEGIARFVEDQAVEMDRRGLRFDDRTAPSLEAAAQAAAKNVLFPPSTLVALNHLQLNAMPDREIVRVQLRNTVEGRILSPVSLFYEESGAIVYLLVMEGGEEGRRAFFAYLDAVYNGIAPASAWTLLGFPTAAKFDARVKEFLGTLR